MKLRELFRENAKYGDAIFEVEEFIIHIYFDLDSPLTSKIDEAKHRGDIELGKQYSANKHNGHISGAQKHLHIYAGQTQIASVNVDGSGHDGYSGTRLPNKVVKAIKSKFPDFNIPSNNILESINKSQELLLKCEFTSLRNQE